MSHLIRPAIREDVPMLAEVVLLAARSHVEIGVFDLAIATNEDDRLAAISTILTTDKPSWCHYENFLVACVDGRPAAALSGYAAYDDSLLPLDQAFVAGFRAIGMDDDQIGAAFKNILVFMTCITDDEKGAWIIEWVACLEEFRRRGLIRELLRAILERGRERGHELSQIGILHGNISAQRAYEDVGFQLEYEKTDPNFEAIIGSPGMARLLLRG